MPSILRRGWRFGLWLYHGTRGRLHRAVFQTRLKLFGSQISRHAYQAALRQPLDRDRERPAFFVDAADKTAWITTLKKHYPDAAKEIIESADRYLEHEFDLLGSGPRQLGRDLPWQTDFKTNYSWPLSYWADINYWSLDKPIPYDIKVPWELSRFQWLPILGQAYWLTGDARYAHEFVALIDDWITNNPPELGPNWCVSMEVAIRAANWLAGYAYFANAPALDQTFCDRFFTMLLAHGRHLMNHLEVSEAPGNHYVSDGAGLVFLGLLLPEFQEAESWLSKGKEIILGELRRQVLPDGVDYEMSTSYHRLMVELFGYCLLLLEMHGHAIKQPDWDRIEKMLEFVMAYTRPDGSIAQVGDNDNGRFLIWSQASWTNLNDHRYLLAWGASRFGRGDMKTLAGSLPLETFWLVGEPGLKQFSHATNGNLPARLAFPDGGFFSWRNHDRFALIRHGGVGRRGFGGHSHNDVASFEYFDTVPIFVDPGTGTYTARPALRNQFRSTMSHTTVSVDEREQRQFASDSLFALVSTGTPELIKWEAGRNEHDAIFAGEHREYAHLGVTHRRHWESLKTGFAMTDQLLGSGEHTIRVHFALAPDVTIKRDGDRLILSHQKRRWSLSVHEVHGRIITVEIQPSRYSPGYGQTVATTSAIFVATGRLPVAIETRFEVL